MGDQLILLLMGGNQSVLGSGVDVGVSGGVGVGKMAGAAHCALGVDVGGVVVIDGVARAGIVDVVGAMGVAGAVFVP